MSSSNAAAIRRRAGINPQPATSGPASTSRPSSTASPVTKSDPPKLTLPEVISNFDKRIIKLEENIKNISGQRPLSISEQNVPSNINEVLDEFNLRFEVLAEEISMLKDTILKLQSFTMDVNKVLMDERVRVLSDLGTNVQFTNDDADVTSVFSLASEVTNSKNNIGQESPTTSVDMREEIHK